MNTNAVDFFKNKPVEINSSDKKLIIAAWQLKNPDNMGKVIRLAHNVGAERVLFIRGNEQQRKSKIRRTAGFSYDQMPWQVISEEAFLEYLQNFQLTVLETCDGAENIFKQKIPGTTILLAGSESHGIPEHIIQKSSCKIFIPMPGGCKSMNISNALSVAAFEWLRQQRY
ncbi:MAG: TrmH family RNA methyltransferase [Draconibacterium sp.]